MTKKPNLKKHQGKNRIYLKIAGATGIQKLFVWNNEQNEYLPPERGKNFVAMRYELDEYGIKKRRNKYFETLAQARSWQSHLSSENDTEDKKDYGPTLESIIEEWRQRRYPGYAPGTRDQYDKLIALYVKCLFNLPIRKITPRVIDTWICDLKKTQGQFWQGRKRKSFDKELICLGVILRYYENYHDDLEFRFPIKRRHRQDVKLRVHSKPKSKDLPLEDFFKFREQLQKGKYAEQMVAMATLQYFQALRISEASAIFWEDVEMHFKSPEDSRLIIRRHLCWARTRNGKSEVRPGFKNSHVLGGEKEMPLFPETFKALKSVFKLGAKGLVFQDNQDSFFSYRKIQHAYNLAFKRAGLDYSSTHVMRHGGCRNVFNETKDIGVAAQILGNVSMETVEVYAKRYKSALTDLAKKHWQEDSSTGSF